MSKKPDLFYLADFVATAKQDWSKDKKKFLQRMAFIRDKCKRVNPACVPLKISPDLQAIVLKKDNRKRPQMQNKVVFTANLQGGAMIEDAIVVSQGNLTTSGPILSSIVFVDGDLILPERQYGIYDSLIFVTGYCRTGLVVDKSLICCQGVLHAFSIFSTAVFADQTKVQAMAKDSQFLQGATLEAHDKIGIKFRKIGEELNWFKYYSVARFPLQFKRVAKDKFVVSEVRANSKFAKSGIKVGDQIVEVNRLSQFENRLDLLYQLRHEGATRTLTISILRDGKRHDFTLSK